MNRIQKTVLEISLGNGTFYGAVLGLILQDTLIGVATFVASTLLTLGVLALSYGSK